MSVLFKGNTLDKNDRLQRWPMDATEWQEWIRELNRQEVEYYNRGVYWYAGAGSPEGAVTAPIGSLYSRTNGGASTSLYVKESGTGNTGWVAK